MKAFVGHSFDPKDENLINKILSFLTKNSITWDDGDRAQNKDISDKIKKRISDNEIFIGIFTVEREIKQESVYQEQPKRESLIHRLKLGFFPDKPPKILPPIYTTSNWVIQESGFAIGKERKLILLVERGIDKFPELQGDAELILFDRCSLDTALVNLLQMIQDIRSKSQSTEQMASREIPTEDKEGAIGVEAKQKGLPWGKMFEAQERGDIPGFVKIYQDEIREHLKEPNALFWDALVCGVKYRSGDSEALDKLIEMSEKTKNYDVVIQLASCYDSVGKNDDARKEFLKSIALTEDINEKLNSYISIAKSYAREKGYDTAINTLLEVANTKEFFTELEKVFVGLSEIAKIKEDDDLYIAFAEKVLSINPVNTTLRFNLGLKYLNLKKNDLAVYHYKELLHNQESSGCLNNLAIGYAGLDMKAKEAACYEKAISKKDDTLPYANVSQKYLDEGFTNTAERLLKEANELSVKDIEVVENVGKAKGRLKSILEEEEKKEKEILGLAEQIHKFRIRHTDAYSFRFNEGNLPDITGKWDIAGKWNVDFKSDKEKNTFLGMATLEVEEPAAYPLHLGFLLGSVASKEKQIKIVEIEINLTISNFSGKYSLKVTERKKGESVVVPVKTILGSSSDNVTYSASGLLIFNKAASNADTFEENNKGEKLFLKWTKV